ncbi:uncharacterized protein LOC122304862 [Carya illinoinensis]|uniref:uncharacterized protein LOC122304862 n=1 Tax=Carya illinoinensis TaxID=32201 RepID=UPI001C722D6C|nr:uncharacterized protein LOC122304862 [Carya illinoinensis]
MDNMQSDLSFWDLANLARDRGSDSLLAKFVAIMWGLWYRRNKRIYENISMHINVTVNNALSLQQEYAQVQFFDVSNQKINKVVRWHPPPMDFLKLNIDGATFNDQSIAGIGVVLRDHNGEVVVTCSKVEKEVSSVEFIDAIALLRGLQLCVQWGVPKIMLEIDCLILVNALNANFECLTDFEFILQDIRRLIDGFQEVKVVHVNRLGNLVAHRLARHAWLIDDICMWWDYCPSFVSQVIWLDKLSICKDT